MKMKTYEMHVSGPDDVIVFTDELEALQRANEVNKAYLADRAANPENEVLCVATVTEVEAEEIYCQACSETGGADRGIYHLPPACK